MCSSFITSVSEAPSHCGQSMNAELIRRGCSEDAPSSMIDLVRLACKAVALLSIANAHIEGLKEIPCARAKLVQRVCNVVRATVSKLRNTSTSRACSLPKHHSVRVPESDGRESGGAMTSFTNSN